MRSYSAIASDPWSTADPHRSSWTITHSSTLLRSFRWSEEVRTLELVVGPARRSLARAPIASREGSRSACRWLGALVRARRECLRGGRARARTPQPLPQRYRPRSVGRTHQSRRRRAAARRRSGSGRSVSTRRRAWCPPRAHYQIRAGCLLRGTAARPPVDRWAKEGSCRSEAQAEQQSAGYFQGDACFVITLLSDSLRSRPPSHGTWRRSSYSARRTQRTPPS